MKLYKQIVLFILFTYCFVACKKDKMEVLPISTDESGKDIDDTFEKDTSYFLSNFENVIFQYNLRSYDSTSYDYLDLTQIKFVKEKGMQLMPSRVLKTKYPSTLDRSQLIIDLHFKPQVVYKNANTGLVLTKEQIKSDKIPFKAEMLSSKTFIGKSLLGIAGTVFGFKVQQDSLVLEIYKMTSETFSSSIDWTEENPRVKVSLKEFFGDVNQNLWEKFNLRFILTKDANLNQLEVHNLQTGAIIKCIGRSKLQSNGCQWGYGFIRSENEQVIHVQNIVYRSLDSLSTKVLFFGHSFIEGNSLANLPEGFNARYAIIIKNQLKGRAVISGMGGAKTSDLLKKLKMDLDPFNMKYVVIDCIANEQSSETWRLNTIKLIKTIEEKRAIPILVTGAPRPGYDKMIGEVNHLIRNVLGYRYIDLNEIVAVNKSPLNWKQDYSLPDLVHLSVLGHQEVANHFFEVIPELLD